MRGRRQSRLQQNREGVKEEASEHWMTSLGYAEAHSRGDGLHGGGHGIAPFCSDQPLGVITDG